MTDLITEARELCEKATPGPRLAGKQESKEGIKMYRCDNCGAEFEEPKMALGETLEHFGRPGREWLALCPKCGIDDIEEMEEYECAECHGEFPLEKVNPCRDIYGVAMWVCDECTADIVKRLALLVRDNFTDYERDLLIEIGQIA